VEIRNPELSDGRNQNNDAILGAWLSILFLPLLAISATSEDSVRFIDVSFLHSVHAEMLLLGTSGVFTAG